MINDTVAYCGLFCGSCGVYIATMNEDDEEMARIAAKMNVPKDEIACRGCRSSVLSPHCRNCGYRECARSKNIDNCEQCGDFPCEELKNFQKQMPHRAELFESAQFRKESGVDAWTDKMNRDYTCESCGALNSPYYISCRKCGNEFGNSFVKRHISLFRK